MKLVFATRNQHKLNELRQIMNTRVNLISLDELGYLEDIEETGKTLTENALLKARHIYNLCKIDTFADDTGLEIEVLNWAPGVLSARYAGEEKDPVNNMRKVLGLMDYATNRRARFRTSIALIFNGKEHLFEGIVNGEILSKPAGSFGFGYDPIFKPEGFSVSFAQMDSTTKNNISHRGKAVEQLVSFLNNQEI